MKSPTDLRVVPVGHVQDFQDHFRLVHEPIISHFLSDPFEDFGERPLTQTLHLKREMSLADYKPPQNDGQSETRQVRMRRVRAYKFQVLFPDLVENHLADVVSVERWRQRHFKALVAPTHQQAGLFWRGGRRQVCYQNGRQRQKAVESVLMSE